MTIVISIQQEADRSFHRVFIENHFFLHREINSRNSGRNAIKSPEFKWPNGIVPYYFSDEYIERERSSILVAMEIFRKETCIRFIHKSYQSQFVEFKKSKDNGCSASIGYRPKEDSPAEVYFTEECLRRTGVIQHELLHVLGLWHEQSRSDRDDYVEILWENILPGLWCIFDIYGTILHFNDLSHFLSIPPKFSIFQILFFTGKIILLLFRSFSIFPHFFIFHTNKTENP